MMNTLQSSCTSKLCILTNALHGDSLQTRMAAVPALVAFGANAVESLCHKMLNDDNDEVRWRAGLALGMMRLNEDECLDPLIEALYHDPVDLVRDSAAWALGEIGDQRALEPLLTALNDGNEQSPVLAAYALAKFGAVGIAALQTVVEESADETNRHRRNAALAALAWAHIKMEIEAEYN